MATGLEPILDWPTPTLRPVGLFLETVPQINWNQRYGFGVTFQPMDLADLSLIVMPTTTPCATEADQPAARECKAVVVQTAFNVIDSIVGPTREWTEDELKANINDRWPLLISEAFAREFLAGAGGSDHNLTADAVGATTPSTVREGIAELEEQMALGLGNTLGMIHMTPSALVYAVTSDTVSYNNGRYYSPGGHAVVADAGYQVAETTTTTMFGTGLVRWAAGPRDARMDTVFDSLVIGTVKNQIMWTEQAYGIIVFDPATVYKTVATRA